jgi:hypothetical protein
MPEELAGSTESFILQIITTFLTETPFLKELLAEAFAQDPDKLVQLAHKISCLFWRTRIAHPDL